MKHRKPLPPKDTLLRLFSYDPDSGVLVWRVNPKKGPTMVGQIAGGPDKRGYWRVSIKRSTYKVHLIVWKIMTGRDPLTGTEVDHRDLNKGNNRWSNLRLSTRSQNAANMGLTKRNTSGFKGVHFYRPTGRWRAVIRVNDRLHFIGEFDTPQEAHAAYVRKAKEFFGEFARVK